MEDQEELAEVARQIEARRKGVHVLDDDEEVAIEEGLEQARRGEFVPDDEILGQNRRRVANAQQSRRTR